MGSSSSDSGSKKSDSTPAPSKTAAKTEQANIQWPDPQPAVEPRSGGSKSPIKIGVLSECQGAFGSFDNQNMAGVVAAMSQFAGAKPKNPNLPRAGWTGGAIDGHPLQMRRRRLLQRPVRHGHPGDPQADGAARAPTS